MDEMGVCMGTEPIRAAAPPAPISELSLGKVFELEMGVVRKRPLPLSGVEADALQLIPAPAPAPEPTRYRAATPDWNPNREW